MMETITSPEFVKRMVVDAENMSTTRKKFFQGETLTPKEIQETIATIPRHRDVNWGPNRLTMIPWTAIEQVDTCIRETVAKNIPGDFVETGAWRGGTCIVARSIYKDLGVNRKVYVADSFEGLPKPNSEQYPDDKNDTHYLDENLKASLETVQDNFRRFGLLDDQVVFLKGWFKDTMPTAPIDKISVLRLDGDMYESTIDVLKNLYHKLSVGGYCIIDDYFHKACQAAVQDFRSKNGITEMIHKVDQDPLNEVHFWIKEKETSFANRNYAKKGVVRMLRVLKNSILIFVKRVVNTLFAGSPAKRDTN